MTAARRRLSRRTFLRVGLRGAGGLAVLALPAACGGDGDGGGGGGQDGPFSGEVAVSHLDSVVSAAPFHVAAALGYYDEEDLELDLVSFPGGADTVRAIATTTSFGMPATLPALTAFQKGQRDLRLISGAFNKTEVVYIVPASSRLQAAEDLRGAKIAVSQPGSISTYFATRSVTEVGLEPGKDVQILNVGGPPDAWTAASQGVADVAWSTGPLSAKLVRDGEARILFRATDYVPDFADNTYWATESFIEESGPVLERWLRAQGRAMETIRTDTTAAAQAYAKRVDLDPAVAEEALKAELDGFSLDIDMAAIQANVEAGAELGQLDPGKLDLDEVVVRDFTA